MAEVRQGFTPRVWGRVWLACSCTRSGGWRSSSVPSAISTGSSTASEATPAILMIGGGRPSSRDSVAASRCASLCCGSPGTTATSSSGCSTPSAQKARQFLGAGGRGSRYVRTTVAPPSKEQAHRWISIE